MWFCRQCCNPVGLAARRCPRCRRRWPAVTGRLLRRDFALVLVGVVRLAWWAAPGR
ncbi:MAG TPA: hypothetical protein VF092_19745 [Longimicrobium sp.]